MENDEIIEESNAAPPWTVLDSKSKKPNKFESIKIIREQKNPESITSEQITKNNYAYDILYENQRGLFVFGLPKFSSKALNQIDPHTWTDKNQKYSPMDIHNYQLPDPTWEWVHKEWMIDMSGDIDEEGWEYALNFHNSSWHGCYQPFRSFVRRRRWIRLRCKKGVKDNSTPSIPARSHVNSDAKTDDFEELWQNVKTSRLDREKLKLIDDYINDHNDINNFYDRLNDLVNIFDHQENSKKFLEENKSCPDLNPYMLKFFSDARELLNHIEQNINNEKIQKKMSKGKEKHIE
ncbi:hypothetical protein RhiirA5_405733 [Rhizophagus irregularis]|uniref:Peroxin/Ferlin domain-containing protein n=2 Tax=Rhizophagus irregularis TaxID=588596 RepID=A0A2I1EEK0_9GLOM|nr:hypothetical protein GLOIN_2v1779398 [Rhizophagus irregularis DAOM 181602=DAOM 197198]PKC17550.1 hypothetical protein RhiirA5_405733 [Rhizophagus irregularis]PKC73160.1 hypothetical protein RhiirA1_451485 [Rhizophagus irregularis]PKK80775.1 hypothetical protein RhiirC2_767748 [Rhizophagus irregularis]PKY20558.1 hypothetical protein RhiirB3_433886 [Rhizophagus irregularis]POG67397.1 hypothetical protein GLOIN_2v1779398 [Rhizophagus irregularis DAOM 181602=DAOM 197198]|eukprot:XP_025174263.1 hypothetical protein GLOIN_2v1779398 [Rhizophagus irregularis DAOM 181602=DAOM 197198]